MIYNHQHLYSSFHYKYAFDKYSQVYWQTCIDSQFSDTTSCNSDSSTTPQTDNLYSSGNFIPLCISVWFWGKIFHLFCNISFTSNTVDSTILFNFNGIVSMDRISLTTTSKQNQKLQQTRANTHSPLVRDKIWYSFKN